MAKLILNGATSGSITLESPAVSGTNTLTLPASTGTVILSDSSGNLQFNSGYGSVATAYGCRAWVNFNGTGTVAIRASGNVSSITDNGVGDYTVNFTTAMPDANYSVLATRSTGTNSTTARIFGVYSLATVLVGSVRVYSYYYDSGGNSTQDIDFASVSIFR